VPAPLPRRLAPVGLLSGFTKLGAGTLTLSGNNTYTGGTTVSAGALRVNNTAGSGTGAGSVTVNGGTAVLGGTGIITGAVAVRGGGDLAPGNSVGTLTVNNTVTFGDSTGSGNAGTFHVELGGTSTSDVLNVTGPSNVLNFVTTGGAAGTGVFVDFGLISGNPFTNLQTYTYTIATTASTAGVKVNGLETNPLTTVAITENYAGPATFSLSRSGNNLVLSFTPVPEPAFVTAVFAAGLAAAGGLRRRAARADADRQRRAAHAVRRRSGFRW
jgi:autotransporter-associated beta strand protein